MHMSHGRRRQTGAEEAGDPDGDVLFRDGSSGGEGVRLRVDEPPVPPSLPIVRHRWSGSASFVLAALPALHVDSSAAVTGPVPNWGFTLMPQADR